MAQFVIGDIHGGHRALMQILDRAPLEHGDTLIFLGDYLDGWSEGPEVIDVLIELSSRYQCRFIRGNHDALCLDYLKDQKAPELWVAHGGQSSIDAYSKVSAAKKKRHIKFLEQLENYIESDMKLFVHAGFSHPKGPSEEFHAHMVYWDRSLWETARAAHVLNDKDSWQYPERLKLYKEIYIGHTPVQRIGATTPFRASNVWNVDTGAAFQGSLSMINTETKAFWQSDPLPSLYPNELGRQA
jgi:serine/threonine protein phosphatase 1